MRKLITNTGFFPANPSILCGCCLLLLFLNLYAQSPVRINEILASNGSIISDEKNEFDDWVEIFNSGTDSVNLEGCFLSDNLKKKQKWRFPSGKPELTIIPPKGFLLVWCDNDLEQDSLLHADFRLDADGESVYLLDKNGKTLVDSVRYPRQYLDFSYGRIAGGKEWSYFLQPSPLKPNMGAAKTEGICPAPEFKPQQSFHHGSAEVSISVPEDCEVYYSTDGSEPRPDKSKKYSSPFRIEKTVVIRARAFRDGFLPGRVSSRTFFVNESISLPVVSVITSPSNLWDPEKGIYTNPFKDAEVPAHFEYFRGDSLALSMDAAFKIFGNTSRNSSKQSFAVLAKEKFGDDRMRHPFFADKPHIKSVDGVVLRGDVTSGRGGGDRETAGERIKNELMYHINRQAGGHCDMQAYQPVVLFLNGNYWGLYNLMERKGKDFIKNNYGIDDIDMLNSYHLDVVEGDTIHYQTIIDYINENDLSDDSLFQPLYSWIDMESLLDYWIFETYPATHDYEVNIRFWRPRTPDGKWRWLAFDEDSWGKPEEQTLHNFTEGEYAQTIFLLGAMLVNKNFRNRFVNRFADLLNTVLSPGNIQSLIDSIQSVIKDEKERDYLRWKNLVHFVEQGSQVAFLKEFAVKRPAFLRQEITERFALAGIAELRLSVSGRGKISVNTIHPSVFPWTGIYFMQVPVTLVAIPDKGHRFLGWSDPRLPKAEKITLVLTESRYELTARFD